MKIVFCVVVSMLFFNATAQDTTRAIKIRKKITNFCDLQKVKSPDCSNASAYVQGKIIYQFLDSTSFMRGTCLMLMQNNEARYLTVSDSTGNFKITNVCSGTYTILANYFGEEKRINGFVVKANHVNFVNVIYPLNNPNPSVKRKRKRK